MFDQMDPSLTSLIVGAEESEAIAVCLRRLMDETGATQIVRHGEAYQDFILNHEYPNLG